MHTAGFREDSSWFTHTLINQRCVITEEESDGDAQNQHRIEKTVKQIYHSDYTCDAPVLSSSRWHLQIMFNKASAVCCAGERAIC